MTGSFDQSAAANTLETTVEGTTTVKHGATVSASVLRAREKAHAMAIDAYVLKLKEYRLRIDELEAELQRCRQDSDSLVYELKDTQTQVIMLQESKA